VAQQVVSEAIALERVDFVREVAARMPLYVICQLMRIAKVTSHTFSN
jgi:hypothetical protein